MKGVASIEDRQKVREEVLVRIYRSKHDGQWYWQIKNKGNHEVEGSSSEGYADRRDCEKNLMRMTGFEPDLVVDEGA